MSQTENHWDEIVHIEAELMRYMTALGLDWHDEAVMLQLATETKAFGPANAQAAYASNDPRLITKAKFFALVSVRMKTMESAARDNREVHVGEIWEAFCKHLRS